MHIQLAVLLFAVLLPFSGDANLGPARPSVPVAGWPAAPVQESDKRSPRVDGVDRDSLARATELEQVKRNFFEKLSKLAQSGAVSGRKLRAAKLDWQLAKLAVLRLQFPDEASKVDETAAVLKYEFEKKEFEVVNQLYQKNAISNLQYDRAKLRLENETQRYLASVNRGRKKLLDIRVAQQNLKQAALEYEKAVKLFKTRTISRVVLERVQKVRDVARAELAAAKRLLGVRVTVVEDEDEKRQNSKDTPPQKPNR